MQQQLQQHFLHVGYIFVSDQPYLIHTVLGSCVSVCLWDERKKLGGMNHHVYGASKDKEPDCRYGDVSIPLLIEMMLEKGATLSGMKAHVIGGGNNLGMNPKIAEENIAIADSILKEMRIPVIIRNVGGRFGRKVVFNNQTGEIDVFCNGTTCAQLHLNKALWSADLQSLKSTL